MAFRSKCFPCKGSASAKNDFSPKRSQCALIIKTILLNDKSNIAVGGVQKVPSQTVLSKFVAYQNFFKEMDYYCIIQLNQPSAVKN